MGTCVKFQHACTCSEPVGRPCNQHSLIKTRKICFLYIFYYALPLNLCANSAYCRPLSYKIQRQMDKICRIPHITRSRITSARIDLEKSAKMLFQPLKIAAISQGQSRLRSNSQTRCNVPANFRWSNQNRFGEKSKSAKKPPYFRP